MAFELAAIDSALAQSVQLNFVEAPDPVSGFPGGAGLLPLQFPPRIVSDTKSADWMETFKASFEPILTYKGAAARKISIEIIYIVDGGQFTAATIAIHTKKVKGYFYRNLQGGKAIPIVKIKFYDHVGKTIPADFRLIDVNISHGETIIQDKDGVFPLMTKIAITAALTTQIEQNQEIGTLQNVPIGDWY
jgi:hypothetical protein